MTRPVKWGIDLLAVAERVSHRVPFTADEVREIRAIPGVTRVTCAVIPGVRDEAFISRIELVCPDEDG